MIGDVSRPGDMAGKQTGGTRWWQVLVIALLTAGSVGIYRTTTSQSPEVAAPTAADLLAEVHTVTALGRLEPDGEVIRLTAPTSSDGSRIEQLLVSEGDLIEVGQVIAILDNRDRLEAALFEAQQQVEIARANLARVRAGAQVGAIAAQEAAIARIEAERRTNIAAQAATIARLEAQLRNAEAEDQRYESLYAEGAISASLRDSKRLDTDVARQRVQEARATRNRIESSAAAQLREGRATLDRIAEVRPVDESVAMAELRAAEATVGRARADLDRATVRSPQAGQILDIHARPGETVSSDGIAEIGQTQTMNAVVEVYESDVRQLAIGQPVSLTSYALPDETLDGRIAQLGLRIQRQQVVNTDPTANIDAKVVEVRVRLSEASSQQVAGLTDLQVIAAIDIGDRVAEVR
ncbi:MAG: efflux RND transporter periplasmic adaptor subunit [Cyanobacteria bacterium J06642_2]